MSKLDAQRAMREARFARNSAQGPTRREATATGGAPVGKVAPVTQHCGHKSMNGRACTRDAGHPQKSHRYG
jgi:hypothetical protein